MPKEEEKFDTPLAPVEKPEGENGGSKWIPPDPVRLIGTNQITGNGWNR
jgi:hypothetical protein